MQDLSVSLIVPTLNAGKVWLEWIEAVKKQSYPLEKVFVIDSGSTDNTVELARESGFIVEVIAKDSFNHGATRQYAIEKLGNSSIVIFLTQDAILSSTKSIENLIRCFDTKKVSAAFGRQLPRQDANPIEAHARIFNYPPDSRTKIKGDITELGIKTAFISNSFAAYRCTVLDSVGGFPLHIIMGEDMYVAAKMILNDWSIIYCASAEVFHSHNYTLFEEFKRYFDTGVLHTREEWLLKEFRKPEKDGLNYIKSEINYLLKASPLLVPEAVLRTVFKYVGYNFGKLEKIFPTAMKRVLSMQSGYWKQ